MANIIYEKVTYYAMPMLNNRRSFKGGLYAGALKSRKNVIHPLAFEISLWEITFFVSIYIRMKWSVVFKYARSIGFPYNH